MKKVTTFVIVGALSVLQIAHATDRVVTTTTPTGAGSLTAAINALADGDTIKFNIAGAGPHYIQVPPDGFPLITKNDITIDGYSQPGASANTASIHAPNNAVLKIVLTATNGNALSMQTACETSWGSAIPNLGFGDSEQAILGFFHATNAVVQGIVFHATPFTATTQAPANPNGIAGAAEDGPACKGICFAANSIENGGGMCKNFRVSGCWFGVEPGTKQVSYCQDVFYGQGTFVASPAICIATYRTRNANGSNPWWNFPGTIGVAAGSANPRAEFNVIVCGYGFDSEGVNYRFSGNFWGVLPDGVTMADMGVLSPLQQSDGYIEVGRADSNITLGTDGDGVNDDQEGNIFGPLSAGGHVLDFYSINPGTNVVIAGNYFGYDVTGNAFTNDSLLAYIHSSGQFSTFQFGSDFNGVSDSVEGNKVRKGYIFDLDNGGTSPNNSRWISFRGNSLEGVISQEGNRPPFGNGQSSGSGLSIYTNFIDNTGGNGNLDFIPVVGAGTTTTTLAGTCGKPVAGPYTRVIIDLYEADTTPSVEPQGKKWLAAFEDNSPLDSNPAIGAFSFSTAGLGITAGKTLTITATYSRDGKPTIGNISRSGNQTSVTVTGGVGPGPLVNYGIQKSTTVNGVYSYIAAAAGGTGSFTDSSSASFYRATGPLGTGCTSPFADVYVVP